MSSEGGSEGSGGGNQVRVTLGNRQRAADFFEYLARQLRADQLISVTIEIPESGVGHGNVVLKPPKLPRASAHEADLDFGNIDDRATLPGFGAMDDDETHVHVTFDAEIPGDEEVDGDDEDTGDHDVPHDE